MGGALWNWHHKAVSTGMERNKDLLAGLEIGDDSGERRFAESWGTMVGILKAVNFPTSLEMVSLFNYQALPGVWVKESDYALWKASPLDGSQRITLKALWSIHQFEKKWGHLITRLLTWIVSSPEKAEKAVMLIHTALSQGWGATALLKKLWAL